MVNYVSYKGDKMGIRKFYNSKFREKSSNNKAMKAVEIAKLNRSLRPLGQFINERIDHLKSVLDGPVKERTAKRQLKVIKELKATLKSLKKAI